jgi:hypothetical protein
MIRTTLSLMLAAVLAACSSSTAPEVRSVAALAGGSVELTLRMGQEAQAGGSVLRVLFVRVIEDSRCPIDAICVWEGNAGVELGLTLGTGPTVPHVINTSLEPQAVTVGGFTVTLLEVAPAPTSQGPIDPDRYTIKVRVEG